MFIQGALANVGSGVATEQFVRLLAEKAPEGHYFMVQPPPGIIMSAAIDWRVVLVRPEGAATFASALWGVYEELVEPLGRKKTGAPAGILVQIRNRKGQFDQFTVGKEITEKKALLQRVEEAIRVLLPKNKKWNPQPAVDETLASGFWESIA